MEAGYWIVRCAQRLLVVSAGEVAFPRLDAGVAPPDGVMLHIGTYRGLPCHAADVDSFPDLPDTEALPLHAVFHAAGEEAFVLAGRAVQLLDWHRQHRFCGQCGAPTARLAGEFAMSCADCGLSVYPRISPAIMVLVRDGDSLLLARGPHFKPGMFSALAGFVEAGETLEQCAAREVREEVGIEIENLRYFASQSWPFPNSLMLAFTADYASGALCIDPVEIEAAGWFQPDRLPPLPDPPSIARRLIDAALAGRA